MHLILPLVLLSAVITLAADVPFQDEEIRGKIYDAKYRVPKGFVEDHAIARSDHSLYYHQPGWYAKDKAAARKIVQTFLDMPSGIAVRKIEEEKETPRSFDFRGGTIWYRVHKSSVFEWKTRTVAESWQQPGKEPVILGKFNTKGLTKDIVREFAEYDWLIQHYNIAGYKALASSTAEQDGKIIATLYTTQTVFGDFGLSDEITVVEIRYTVDPKDGTTTRSTKVVKQLKGKRN